MPNSQSEPDWLTLDEIVELNEFIVEDSGDPFFVLKPNELESAVQRPRFLYEYDGETDIARLAVRLMLGIAQNHPFEEGNKRTAFIAATIFVESNGYVYDGPDDEGFAELLIAVLEHKADEEQILEAFEANLYSTA